MPGESFRSGSDQVDGAVPAAVCLVGKDRRTNSATKAAETVRRREAERRAESLDQIRAQTAAGTLVVRQMTAAEHEAARQTARRRDTRGGLGGKPKRRDNPSY
jgi:hypothetical protein